MQWNGCSAQSGLCSFIEQHIGDDIRSTVRRMTVIVANDVLTLTAWHFSSSGRRASVRVSPLG